MREISKRKAIHSNRGFQTSGVPLAISPKPLVSDQIAHDSHLLCQVCEKVNTSESLESLQSAAKHPETSVLAVGHAHRPQDAFGRQKWSHLSEAFGFSQKDKDNNIY